MAGRGKHANASLPTVPLLVAVLLVVLVGGGAGAQPPPAGCGPGGTADTVSNVRLDAEQMGNAQLIVRVTASRLLPPEAAIIAVATAYQESNLRNTDVQVDHDSEGLFQLRVGLWTKQVADDPVRSTNWFLDRLIQIPNWQHIALTVAAQTVQRSALPDAYARWQPLATGLVGQLWPTAAATAAVTAAPNSTAPAGAGLTAGAGPRDGATAAVDPTALCPGAGGGIPVAGGGPGSTSIPAGLTIAGSPAGVVAVRFALSQLGKPYVWGAAGPDAYDCSGLTMAAWASAGIALGHFTGLQVAAGTPSPTDLSLAAAGDLVFIAGSDGTASNPGHEGMIAGVIPGPDGRHLLIVQAPHTGVTVQLIDAGRWAGLIVAVRHIG